MKTEIGAITKLTLYASSKGSLFSDISFNLKDLLIFTTPIPFLATIIFC